MKNRSKAERAFAGRDRERGKKAGILLPALFGLFLLAVPLAAQAPPSRAVKVELAIDRGIGDRAEWRIAATRLLGDCFRTFGRWCALDLRLDGVVTWSPDPGRKPLAERLGELRRKVRRGSGDIVLGVIAREHTNAVPLAMASYGRADILVQNLASREAMTYVVLHELCHVFGAADIREKGSVMGLEGPGLSIDAFTAQVVRLNAGRSFDRKSPLLSTPSLDGVISLFEGRARQVTGESEVPLLLTLLYLEKDDLEAAAGACAAAVEADPRSPGLHNLMGTVQMFRGDLDLAIAEFRLAAQADPYEPGILFNLGLAYVQKGLLDDAAAAYREALKADPDYPEARNALELVLSAGQDVEAARGAVKPFLLALRSLR